MELDWARFVGDAMGELLRGEGAKLDTLGVPSIDSKLVSKLISVVEWWSYDLFDKSKHLQHVVVLR